MPARLGPAVVDALLLGPENRRRQVQDFPVLGDVWSRFADRPGEPHDLLIIPTWEKPTGAVADLIESCGTANDENGDCSVAYLQDLVAASLRVRDLPASVIPATAWWDRIQEGWEGEPPDRQRLEHWIACELLDLLGKDEAERVKLLLGLADDTLATRSTNDRAAARMGLLLGMFLEADSYVPPEDETAAACFEKLSAVLNAFEWQTIVASGADAVQVIIERHAAFERNAKKKKEEWQGIIFQVTLNRDAEPAVIESVPAIKGDAARKLFSISCKDVGWAIVDSGIDGNHPAFQTSDGKSRIKAAYEFRRIRRILGIRKWAPDWGKFVDDIVSETGLKTKEVETQLGLIAADAKKKLPIDWRKIEPLIELKTPKTPDHPHGTHVAGIIGADWTKQSGDKLCGVCPDINLYDFRVLGSDLGDSEFAVSAALQFIRYLNVKSGFPRIHGVNMSLSIRHNVRNYACGRTPVCIEAEALVGNGTVVVAAAGNRGYQQYQLADSTMFESYAASSITDPGNAEGVITVGSTHRHWPHTYGVSFFSSRGPTGDGRLKPDLLAPGERILSCVPGGADDQMDGTSMAAPHVSGAAALLMARHNELKGRPVRIKQILCETATDLGRERSFQGHGMVDVLRAIQSI